MQLVVEMIIMPFEAVYGPIPSDDPESFVAGWVAELKRYSKHQLEVAASEVKRSFRPYGRMPWPSIAHVVDAASKESAYSAAVAGAVIGAPTPAASARRQASDWVLNTAQGREALRGGYGRQLWSMVAQRCQREPGTDHRSISFDDRTIAYHAQFKRPHRLDMMVMFGADRVDEIAGKLGITLDA